MRNIIYIHLQEWYNNNEEEMYNLMISYGKL